MIKLSNHQGQSSIMASVFTVHLLTIHSSPRHKTHGQMWHTGLTSMATRIARGTVGNYFPSLELLPLVSIKHCSCMAHSLMTLYLCSSSLSCLVCLFYILLRSYLPVKALLTFQGPSTLLIFINSYFSHCININYFPTWLLLARRQGLFSHDLDSAWHMVEAPKMLD